MSARDDDLAPEGEERWSLYLWQCQQRGLPRPDWGAWLKAGTPLFADDEAWSDDDEADWAEARDASLEARAVDRAERRASSEPPPGWEP